MKNEILELIREVYPDCVVEKTVNERIKERKEKYGFADTKISEIFEDLKQLPAEQVKTILNDSSFQVAMALRYWLFNNNAEKHFTKPVSYSATDYDGINCE